MLQLSLFCGWLSDERDVLFLKIAAVCYGQYKTSSCKTYSSPRKTCSLPLSQWKTEPNVISSCENYGMMWSFYKNSSRCAYTGCLKKECTNLIISYLRKCWIWCLQTFYSNLAQLEIAYLTFLLNHLNPFKFCMTFEVSQFSAL